MVGHAAMLMPPRPAKGVAMDIVNPKIEDYLRGLLGRDDDEVLREMETRADERDFPIVGRLVGLTLELLARAIRARRVLEMGSGYGYSAYWFSRAVGPEGEVHMTEGDPENQKRALDYLERAGLADRVHSHVGNALEIIDELSGEFDIVFCDIDKGDYPTAWAKARERIRLGGLYLCDNVLWSGRVAEETPEDDVRPGWTAAIKDHNEAIVADPRHVQTVV